MQHALCVMSLKGAHNCAHAIYDQCGHGKSFQRPHVRTYCTSDSHVWYQAQRLHTAQQANVANALLVGCCTYFCMNHVAEVSTADYTSIWISGCKPLPPGPPTRPPPLSSPQSGLLRKHTDLIEGGVNPACLDGLQCSNGLHATCRS